MLGKPSPNGHDELSYVFDARRSLIVGLGLLPLLLSGCASFDTGSPAADIRDIPIDRQVAVAKLNAYRAQRNLPPVALDPRLDDVSQQMAQVIARNDSMNTRLHSASGLSDRLDRAGYRNYAGAENLGAGYRDFNAAFAGWQGSKDHDKNLLNPYVTRVGIAKTERSDGKWRNFWVMILSRPEEDGRPTI